VSNIRIERPIDLTPDAGPAVRRRSSKETVLRAAIELISQHGSDRVTVSEIISVAGVSRSTVYGYFADARDIYAEIWAIGGAEWLGSLASRPLVTEPQMTSFDAALLDLLAVGWRVPELRELVLPDATALRDTTAIDSVAQTRLTWVLATTLGIALAKPVLPAAAKLGFLVETFASIPDDAIDRYDITPATVPEPPVITDAVPVTGETTADRIVRASIDVVGSSGYHSATMMRICRVARLTVGAAAPLFASLEDLHDQGFASMHRNVVAENARGFRQLVVPGTGNGADAYAAFTRTMTDPTRARWRRYRHELYVAARTSPEIAAKVRAAVDDTSRAFIDMLTGVGIDPKRAELLVLVNQVLSLGMAYVGKLGFPVATIDHRIATRHFWATVIDAPG